MEVHHHHHESYEHKKWHHYFWEFFMLFLAVTLGFFVENQREHFVEHKREAKYMQNLLQDLCRDTAAMHSQSLFQKRAVVFADSLVDVLNNTDRNKYLSNIYYYARILTIYNPFFYSNATIDQLKSSGSLRLIKKEFVADSIVQYDIWSKRLLAVEENIKEVIQDFRSKMGEVLNADAIKNMIDTSQLGGTFGSFVKRPNYSLPPVSDDKKSINQLCTNADFLLTLYQYQFKAMNNQKARANRLIELLKKEYHLQ
ncbi:MAG TPA: hypothetical protein VG676_06690 [Chitinophagaceae bacterium]|jgi:hypothetical protein|nr:hypothetical protein [Chitinophagaceae bacterium]